METYRRSRNRSESWLSEESGNIFYRPPRRRDEPATAQSHFPSPHIGPRRTRPHSIHIITFPPGYVPRDQRPGNHHSHSSRRSRSKNNRKSKVKQSKPILALNRPLLGKFFSSFGGNSSPTPLEPVIEPRNSTQSEPSEPRPDVEDPIATTTVNLIEEPPNVDMATSRISVPPAPHHIVSHNNFSSARSIKPSITSNVTEIQKPVASGSGVSCSIVLAEPTLFLYGFDHDGHSRRDAQVGSSLLRGKLQLKVTKNVKIKAVQLKLLGKARTEWPEGVPPLKQDIFEEDGLRTQVLTFFNAMNSGWESDYGNQCTYTLKDAISANSSSTNLAARASLVALPVSLGQRALPTAKELKRLSLQSTQSRSFGKGDNGIASATQAKGFKVFYPGTYDYSFELPIDHHQLETTKLPYGSVKWELHATVDRSGAFKPNLHGMKEVCIVRLPDQMSLEMSEPISINRSWDNQLHYDIAISGKSFPIGAKIPIAFKLTPLAKVQLHKLKVYVTESTEYWTNNHRVTRKDPGRKILLLEKTAGKPLDTNWSASSFRTIRGGELDPEERREARQNAAHRLSATNGSTSHSLPRSAENMLGDLDLGLECMWGSTEIEANVQIPTCEMMAKNKDLRLHPDCSWKNANVFHWIKVVMRVSRSDPDDPSGTKRRHFEISIDSPFTILDCRATQANTYLPAYSGAGSQSTTYQSACGCPDATRIATDASPASSSDTLVEYDAVPAAPAAAHVHNPVRDGASGIGIHRASRPMHLLRAPSFNPPGFLDDSSPPPLSIDEISPATTEQLPMMTPPPNYDTIIGTPSVDGMADYFSRLAAHDEVEDSSDSESTPPRILERSGRVNVAHPRTPGGRMQSRSMEIERGRFELQSGALPKRKID